MRKKATILATACVIIVVVILFEFYVLRTSTKQTTTESYFTAYYNEFKNTPTTSYNYTFSPPVSMYHALLIALESGGWNATSLKNMTISVGLDYYAFFKNLSSQSGWETLELHFQNESSCDGIPNAVSSDTSRRRLVTSTNQWYNLPIRLDDCR